LDLRTYRMGLIQTPDQLKFSYLAIAQGAAEDGHIDRDILADVPKSSNGGGMSLANADSSSEDEDGAPPPLPPPRSESLKMQQLLEDLLTQAAAHQYDAGPEREEANGQNGQQEDGGERLANGSEIEGKETDDYNATYRRSRG